MGFGELIRFGWELRCVSLHMSHALHRLVRVSANFMFARNVWGGTASFSKGVIACYCMAGMKVASRTHHTPSTNVKGREAISQAKKRLQVSPLTFHVKS